MITGLPALTFTLPAELAVIEDEVFSGIAAEAVHIPAGVTAIDGDHFSGSSVRYISTVSPVLLPSPSPKRTGTSLSLSGTERTGEI